MKSLFHFSRRKLSSKFGFSILEVMIVGGLMSIIGLAISTVITNSNKAQKRLEQKDSQISIAGYIRSALQRDEFCANAFCVAGDTCAGNALTGLPRTAAQGTIAEVELSALQMLGPGGTAQNIVSCRAANNCNVLLATDPAPKPPAVLGTPVPGQPGFFIYGMRLMNIVFQGESPANTHNSSGQLVIKYATDSRTSSGGQLKDTTINIVFRANNAGVISGCSAGAQDTKWQDGITPGDIYYDAGDVGIGTIDPAVGLHIQGQGTDRVVRIESNEGVDLSNSPNIQLNRSRGTPAAPSAVANADYLGVLNFRGYGATNYGTFSASIRAIAEENFTDTAMGTALAFATTPVGSGGAVGDILERVRINSAGNVGIGTNAPTVPLDIVGNILATTAPGGRIAIRANAGNPNDPGDLVFLNNDNSVRSGIHSQNGAAGQLRLSVEGTDRMTLLNSGNVGVGTTAPTSILHIRDTSDNNRPLMFEGRDDLNGFQIRAPNDTFHINTGANRADAPVMTFRNGNANVGIGTNAPGRKLEVIGTFAVNAGGNSDEILVTNSAVTIGAAGGGNAVNLTQTGNQNLNGDLIVNAGAGVAEMQVSANTVIFEGTSSFTGAIIHNTGDLTGDGTNDISGYATISAVSDIRLKTEIEKIESVSEQLNKLYSYRYVMRNDPNRKQHIGFIAQELLEIFPELVSESTTGYLNVNYMGMVPLLLQGFKETQSRIDHLEVENENLRSALSELSVRLEKLEKIKN